MTWFDILKAGIGNWSNMFKTNKWPNEANIKALNKKASRTHARELDTTINTIEEQLKNLPKKEPPLKEGVVQQMIWGTRKTTKVPKLEINKRLVKLKSFRPMFVVQTHSKLEVKETLQPLVDAFSKSKSIDDFRNLYKYLYKITDGKLGDKSTITQKWMRKLNKKDGGIIDVPAPEFGEAIDIIKLKPDILGGIDKHVASILGFSYQSGAKDTVREVRGGKRDEIIDEDDPLYVGPKKGKKHTALQTKKKRDVAKPKEQEITVQKPREGAKSLYEIDPDKPEEPAKFTGTEEKVKRTGTDIKTTRELTSPKAYAVVGLKDKIGNMTSLPDFRNLMKVLHTSGITKGHILQDFTGTSVDILHDITIVRQRGLNDSMRIVDYGRKGITTKHRKAGYKTDFALDYILEQSKAYDEKFEIGKDNWLLPDSLLQSATKEEKKEHDKNKVRAEEHIKNQIDRERGNIHDEFSTYVTNHIRAKVKGKSILDKIREAGDSMSQSDKAKLIKEWEALFDKKGAQFQRELGATKAEFYLGKSDDELNYNDVIKTFNIEPSEIFRANLFALLFKYFVNSSNESEFEHKIKPIITLRGKTGRWVEFIPESNIFQVTDEESFINTIRTILTFIINFYDKSMLDTYNEHMTGISTDFYPKVEEAMTKLAKPQGINVKEERDTLLNQISDGGLQKFGLNEYVDNLFGIDEDITAIRKSLNDLIFGLDLKVQDSIYDLIMKIGEDTTAQYTRGRMRLKGQSKPAQDHLIDMKLLIKEKPTTDTGGEEE